MGDGHLEAKEAEDTELEVGKGALGDSEDIGGEWIDPSPASVGVFFCIDCILSRVHRGLESIIPVHTHDDTPANRQG